jgi:hypothetical protein
MAGNLMMSGAISLKANDEPLAREQPHNKSLQPTSYSALVPRSPAEATELNRSAACARLGGRRGK